MNHLSTFELDKLALGEAPTMEAKEHLAVCTECAQRSEGQAAARGVFQAEVLPKTMGPIRRRVLREQSFRKWFPVLAATSALAVVAVAVEQQRPEYTAKGSFQLEVFVQRQGKTFRLLPDKKVEAGDAIVPRCISPRPFLLLVSVSEQGQTLLYQSLERENTRRMFQSPNSLLLDAYPGPERLFALSSNHPLDAARIIDRLKKLATADDIRRTTALGIGEEETSILLERSP